MRTITLEVPEDLYWRLVLAGAMNRRTAEEEALDTLKCWTPTDPLRVVEVDPETDDDDL